MSNFVLVHGGMVGGWCWKKVRPLLEVKNCNVLTPTLTGLGERKHLAHGNIDLDLHIDDIVNTIFYENLDEVILLGHSYGGMVITGVADRIPQKIKKLIYVDAVLPKDGESMFDIVDPEIVSYLSKSAHGWEIPPVAPENYGIKDPDDIEWFGARCTSHPLKTFQQPIRFRGDSIKGIETIYIKCTLDHALDSMLDRAEELHIPILSIESGHFPMITHPQKLTDILLRKALFI